MTTAAPKRPRIGLALAGGGPEGGVYELGALRALDESIEGLDLTKMDVYVGVSAGAFLCSCLANGLDSKELCRSLLSRNPADHPVHPSTFYTPALGEVVQRGAQAPRLLLEALIDYLGSSADQTLLDSLTRLSRALPTGLFQNEPIRRYVHKLLTSDGRTDDFRQLARPLYVVATDLDSGEAVRFGEPGYDHVPISTAIQAATAIPAIYPPVTIDGRHYLDGVLLKTLHASVALDADVDLLLCVNPLVPVDTVRAVQQGVMRRGKLVDRGLPTVLSQTFRTLIYSRLQAGMANYEPRYPDQSILLFEPDKDDYRMALGNIFRFSTRKAVCEHAYIATRENLRARRKEIAPLLEPHGLKLRDWVLDDDERSVWDELSMDALPVTRRLDEALTRLESLLSKS